MMIAGQLLTAQADPWASWALARLRPGRELTVETSAPSRKLKGTLVSRDANGITLQLKSGASETLSRESIRKVTAKRKGYNYAPLIGAGAGAGIMGILTGRPKMDFTGGDVAMFTAIGAGAGAAIGWAVRAAGNDELIYQASKP